MRSSPFIRVARPITGNRGTVIAQLVLGMWLPAAFARCKMSPFVSLSHCLSRHSPLSVRSTSAAKYLLLTILAVSGMPAAFVDGVGNFDKVNEHLYRGAQPTERGFRSLSQLGIRTVLDLRMPEARSNEEER